MIPRWNAKHIPEMKKGAHHIWRTPFSAFAGLNEASLLLEGQRFLAELLHQLLNLQRGFAGPRAGCLVVMSIFT